MQLRPIARGLKTWLVREPDQKGTGGTNSARYCYSVWLRHLVHVHAAGLNTRPRTVAEFGPGDSLGIGLAALLTGANHYNGLDVVEHSNPEINLRMLEELIPLFQARADIPGPDEIPLVFPLLDSYRFPHEILTEERLASTLSPRRIQSIRDAVAELGRTVPDEGGGISLAYRVPWSSPELLAESSVDMIYSQAALEHVDDLDLLHRAMRRWLVPGGIMTHQIDFKSHGMTQAWNGHWEYPEAVWRIVRGRRSFLLNRLPLSAQLAGLRAHGFEIVRVVAVQGGGGIPRARLAAEFRNLSEEDFTTSGAFVVAVKPVR